MKLAQVVFTVAGVWGIVVLVPLFFLFDVAGRPYAPPTSYPHFFYGFLTTALAWQIAFIIIGSDPVRFRPLMIPCIVEKLAYVVAVAMLHGGGRIAWDDASTAVPDLVLGLLFAAAFVKTPRSDRIVPR